MKRYVIYLSDALEFSNKFNSYGYWAGKDYIYQNGLYPVTDTGVTGRTKLYTTKKRAEKGLEAALNRTYAYVLWGKVVEVEV